MSFSITFFIIPPSTSMPRDKGALSPISYSRPTSATIPAHCVCRVWTAIPSSHKSDQDDKDDKERGYRGAMGADEVHKGVFQTGNIGARGGVSAGASFMSKPGVALNPPDTPRTQNPQALWLNPWASSSRSAEVIVIER